MRTYLHISQSAFEPLERLQLGTDITRQCADGGILDIAQQVLHTCISVTPPQGDTAVLLPQESCQT